MIKECEYCNKIISIKYKSVFNVRRFCSRVCKSNSQRNKEPWNKNKKGIQIAWNKGLKGIQSWHNISGLRPHKFGEFKHNKESIEKNRLKHLGISPGNKGKKSIFSGELHWNWQGGKTKEREKLRKGIEYKNWRENIFIRDDFTCQMCMKKGCKIHADHIKPWSLYPELRFSLDNGRTLCVDCHKSTPTYLKNIKKAVK